MERAYKTTEAQRASSKRYRERMISEHRCPHCGGQDERTLAGYTTCETCHMKKLRYERTHRIYGPDREANLKEYRRRWRDRCRAEHRCTSCGRPLPDGETEHVTCERCRKRKQGWYGARKGRCSLIRDLSEAEKRQVCLNCPYPECIEGGD